MWGHIEVSPHVSACIINMPKQKRSKDLRWDMEPQYNIKKQDLCFTIYYRE